MQLIPDLSFRTGISLLSQKDHANGDKITVLGTHSFYGTDAPAPRWKLAQWDSGSCLVENLIPAPANTITDGVGRSFIYEPEENTLTFELDTSLYYGGTPARQGDYWPHLLIEQDNFGYFDLPASEQAFYRCNADKMILSFDIRLTDYSLTPIEGDWVRAAQFLMYFYVKGIETNDFCWFGLRLFDNRAAFTDHYIGYDGGKADASGAMIYSIGSKYLYKNTSPTPGGDWIHVEIDLRPYLLDMLAKGSADRYFKAKSLKELCINGMNLGLETIGTFDHTMQIRNLSLTSYPED